MLTQPESGRMMMRFGVAGGHQGVAHRLRKRNIHQRIAVHMPNFAAAEAKLDASVTVRRRRHAVPTAGSLANTAFRSRDRHDAAILAHRGGGGAANARRAVMR